MERIIESMKGLDIMHWRSKLIHHQTQIPEGFRSLCAPVYRASTVLFNSQGSVCNDWKTETSYSYGLYGTPTALELAGRIAELEGARHTFLLPSGQAAILLVYLTFCQTGSHALVPLNAYGPNRELAAGLLKGLGIEVEPYDPLLGADIAKLIRPNTTLIWCESPGSVTFEVQDVPAIVKVAHEKSIPVALDNSWAAGILFDAFAHGVDVSMQALTKYVGGHSDLLLGSVSASTEELYEKIGRTWRQMGQSVSPDECSLALRGLQTLGVRLEKLEKSALDIAEWFAKRDEVETVFHPALPSCPGHEIWKRDFVGSSSVFSVLFKSKYSAEQLCAFVDTLKLFGIGLSWGSVQSLAVIFPKLDRPNKDHYRTHLVRFNIGLEEPSDLISDITASISQCLK
jgi:cysteine-S-conjugate beta-lyase